MGPVGELNVCTDAAPAKNLTRADFQGQPLQDLSEGVPYKPDLLVYNVRGELTLLKDYSRRSWLCRNIVGVLATAKEARALRALEGVEGVPQFRGRPDRYCVAMTYVPGRYPRARDPQVGGNEAFVRALEEVVAAMHSRGVVHLDLRHRTNVIATEDDKPLVLDFESALKFNTRWLGGRLAVRLLGILDQWAVQNWRRRLCPGSMTAAELRRAQRIRALSRLYLPRRFLDAFLEMLRRRD